MKLQGELLSSPGFAEKVRYFDLSGRPMIGRQLRRLLAFGAVLTASQ